MTFFAECRESASDEAPQRRKRSGGEESPDASGGAVVDVSPTLHVSEILAVIPETESPDMPSRLGDRRP